MSVILTDVKARSDIQWWHQQDEAPIYDGVSLWLSNHAGCAEWTESSLDSQPTFDASSVAPSEDDVSWTLTKLQINLANWTKLRHSEDKCLRIVLSLLQQVLIQKSSKTQFEFCAFTDAYSPRLTFRNRSLGSISMRPKFLEFGQDSFVA